MKLTSSILLTSFLVLTQTLGAQTFTEVIPSPPFSGVRFSAIAFADIDGDGYKDLLITGQDSSGIGISKLYTNDSLGNFIEKMGTNLHGLQASSAAFSDINSDGYQDVLITGVDSFSSTERIAKLYTNDGSGNFTEMPNTPFEGVWFGTVNFSDVNNDGYPDVLITGQNSANERITKLYTNDSLGNFTEMIGTPFVAVRFSAVAFADVNGDGYQDVLITGQDSLLERIAKLYTNDGLGNFTEISGTPFIGAWESSVVFSDVNGDGHQDVLISGATDLGEASTQLCLNDGFGNFTEMTSIPFDDAWRSTMAFSDVNNDGYPDALIAGENNLGQRIAKLYINDSSGNFTEMMNTPFDGVRFGTVALSDVNSDGNQDILITGENIAGQLIAKLYINNGDVSSNEGLLNELSLDFTPYPNPVISDRLNVNYHSPNNGIVMVKIYGPTGQVLHQQEKSVKIGEQIFFMDVSAFARGIYILQLDNGKQMGMVKFTIE